MRGRIGQRREKSEGPSRRTARITPSASSWRTLPSQPRGVSLVAVRRRPPFAVAAADPHPLPAIWRSGGEEDAADEDPIAEHKRNRLGSIRSARASGLTGTSERRSGGALVVSGPRRGQVSSAVRVGHGYGPQPANTQALVIVTVEFDGPSEAMTHGPGTPAAVHARPAR